MSIYEFWLRLYVPAAGLLVTAFAVSAEEITIFYPADDCGKMVIRNYAPLSPIASTGQFCIAA